MTEHQVFAVVYDPLCIVRQRMLGCFTSKEGNPRVFSEDIEDKYNTNMILFSSMENENKVLFVGVSKKYQEVIVGNPSDGVKYKFFLSAGIARNHPWAWKDEKGRVWMTTEDFGSYLTYLLNLHP